MADRTDVDPAVLDGVSRTLRQSGDALDSVGNGAPGTPDAGELTALMGGVLAHLSQGAGNLVLGLREAGDRVSQARSAYLRQDASAAQEIQGLF